MIGTGLQTAGANEYPWLAQLYTFSSVHPRCSGILVNDRFIVSSRSCITNDMASLRTSFTIVLGNSLTTNVSTVSTKIVRFPIKVTAHPSYVANGQAQPLHDLMAVEVAPIDFAANPEVRPICLPSSKTETYAGKTGTVVGWGVNSDSVAPTSAQELPMTVISNTACSDLTGNMAGFPPTYLLCASKTGSPAMCNGDRGNALVVQIGANYEYAGITNFDQCDATKPTIFSRITSYQDWISSATSTGQACDRA